MFGESHRPSKTIVTRSESHQVQLSSLSRPGINEIESLNQVLPFVTNVGGFK